MHHSEGRVCGLIALRKVSMVFIDSQIAVIFLNALKGKKKNVARLKKRSQVSQRDKYKYTVVSV